MNAYVCTALYKHDSVDTLDTGVNLDEKRRQMRQSNEAVRPAYKKHTSSKMFNYTERGEFDLISHLQIIPAIYIKPCMCSTTTDIYEHKHGFSSKMFIQIIYSISCWDNYGKPECSNNSIKVRR